MNYSCSFAKLLMLCLGILFILSGAWALTTTGLVAWYDFNSGTTTLHDTYNNDNNGTNLNTSTFSGGRIGNAYYYNGTAKTDLTNTGFPTTQMSIAMWIKATTTGVNKIAFMTGTYGSTNFEISNNTNIGCTFGTGDANGLYSSQPLTDNNWHLIICTYDGHKGKGWVDNVYLGEKVRGAYTIGTTTPRISYGSDFNGYFDETSIWDRNLNATEINELFNGGAGLTYCPEIPNTIKDTNFAQTCIYTYTSIDANFDYSINKTLSLFDLFDTSTDLNVTINDWNWLVDNIKVSDDQNYFFQGIQNTDYNICLQVGGLGNDSNFYSDTFCRTLNIDTQNPTIDGNLVFTPGFVTGFNVNYNLTCYDNSTADITYQVIRNDTNYLQNNLDSNGTTISSNFSFTPPSTATITMNCIDSGGNTTSLTFDTIYALVFRLINEDNGVPLTTADFNGAARMFVKKVVAFDEDGNFSYDFNATSTVTKNFLGYTNNLWFEITYNNAGTDLKIDRKIDFGLIPDTNIGVCVPPLQEFYQQDFYSVTEKEIYLYQPNAKCYVLAGTTYYLVAEGKQITTWTINRPYKAYTINDGLTTILATINGALENRYNLDAIAFNQQAVQIAIGQDTLSFTPGIADSNTINIYFNSFENNYVSTTLTIYNGENQLFTLLEDTNANEFNLIWLYSSYGITDQNMLKIIVVGTDAEGNTTTLTEYFNILGDEFIGDKDPSFIAIIVIFFFLFGITMMSIGKTFGWFGIIVCITSMAISLMAVQTYWLLMIEGGLFICFLYILLSGGLVNTFGGGMR